MPPDRNTTGGPSGSGKGPGGTVSKFSDAIASGQPLSSVGPGHPPSLERGKACLTCRRRRVKCDGARPVCGRCAKSAKAHGEDPTTIVCEYDSSVPKRPPKDDIGRVQDLAAEVAALKQQLLAQQQRAQQESVVAAANAAATASSAPAPRPQTSYAPSSFSSQVASTSAVTLDAPAYTQPQQPEQQLQTTYSFQHSTSSGGSEQADSGPFDSSSFLSNTSGAGTSSGPYAAFASFPSAAVNPLADLADLASSTLSTAQLPSPVTVTVTAASNGHGGNGEAPSFTLPSDLDFDLSLPDIDFTSSAWSLLPASYPPTLPSPPLLNRLLTVYFSKSHLACEIINEARLRSSLLLPAGNPGRPLECLLHAVCATAGLMVSEGFLEAEGEAKYWLREGPDGKKSKSKGAAAFSEYHAKRAEELLQSSFDRGLNLLQIVQAAVLCVFCAYTTARFHDIWSLSGRATRLAVITGLNHLRPFHAKGTTPDRYSGHPSRGGDRINSGRTKARRLREPAMLPPPKDREEAQERLYTFWAVLMSDRMTCAASDWAVTLVEEDVTTLLPASSADEAFGDAGAKGWTEDEWFDSPLSSPLCIHNPSFFFANPSHLVGPHQLYIKATVLLGRVCTFLQRAPDPVGSGYPLEEGRDLRDEPAFRSLERTCTHFRQSVPRELQHSYVHLTTGRIDERLVLAHAMGHVVVILMHEPFCLSPDITVQDESFTKCLEAAKAIVTSVYEISGSSYEIGLLASFLNWIWAVAGRTLVRALALASRRSDLSAASHLAMDVKALIGAMEANKSPVGAVTASVLQRLLADPFQVLPDSPPASSRNHKNFSSRHRSAGPLNASYSSSTYSGLSAFPASGNSASLTSSATSPSHPNPASNVIYLSAFDLPYDGDALSRPRSREPHVSSIGSAANESTTMAYPGTIWEVLDDTPPSGSGGGDSGAPTPGGALDELAKKVVEEASAAAVDAGVGDMDVGWP
ncbi:hypothetical protein JCM11251_007945 [Rhodosporidiobolus azoricus]